MGSPPAPQGGPHCRDCYSDNGQGSVCVWLCTIMSVCVSMSLCACVRVCVGVGINTRMGEGGRAGIAGRAEG